MPRIARYTRIAITVPQEDLAAADRAARAQDRSRSWIIAEAIRRYVGGAGSEPRRSAAAGPLGESRSAQLAADLQLSVEARVRAAEETARTSFLLRPTPSKRVLGFDRYEDYLAWKRLDDRGG